MGARIVCELKNLQFAMSRVDAFLAVRRWPPASDVFSCERVAGRRPPASREIEVNNNNAISAPIMDRRLHDRIKRRHQIMERGVPSVWAESPRHDGSYESDRESDSKSHRSRSHHKSSHHKSSDHKSRHKSHHKSNRHKSSHHKSHRHKSRRKSPSSDSSSSSSKESPKRLPNKSPKRSPSKSPRDSPDTKKKPKTYIEVLNKREEEEFVDQLKRKQDTKSPEPSSSSDPLHIKDFGGALLPGEGAKMAAFVESGKRIPRRGEIGLTSEEIEKYENAGYVMSGSRHRRMEAVRLRKENQVYSADEKRCLANLDREERIKKNEKMKSYFTQIIEAKHQSR